MASVHYTHFIDGKIVAKTNGGHKIPVLSIILPPFFTQNFSNLFTEWYRLGGGGGRGVRNTPIPSFLEF